MDLSPATFVVLALAAFAGGFIDAIAGGGGLITVPALLWAGLPPQLALGTNKLQSSFGTALAVWHYRRAGLMRLRDLWPGVAVTLVAAALGAWAVTRVDASALRKVIPFLLLAIAGWMWLKPQPAGESREPRIPRAVFFAVFGSVLGFYDGFFGPGTGSFWTVACVALLGCDLSRATGITKVMNLTSNFASVVVFAFAREIRGDVALVMIAGQLLGALLGASLVVARGAAIIRPIFLAVVSLLAVKLLLDLRG